MITLHDDTPYMTRLRASRTHDYCDIIFLHLLLELRIFIIIYLYAIRARVIC